MATLTAPGLIVASPVLGAPILSLFSGVGFHAMMTNPGIRWQWVYAAGDIAEADAAAVTTGNVLTNDVAVSKAVSQVAGSSDNVGVVVTGNNGGLFTIASDGAWTFDPAGEFALLTGAETADTSVMYYASDGVGEAMATLTVTVSAAAAIPEDYVAHYKLDTVSGGVLVDETGNFDATIYGSLSIAAGAVGNALECPGNGANYGLSQGYNLAELYVCGWVKPVSVTGAQYGIMGQWHYPSRKSWLIDIYNSAIRMVCYGLGTVAATRPIYAGVWTFFEAWKIGNEFAMCVNRGAPATTAFSTTLTIGALSATIGKKEISTSNAPFNGLIDNIRVYSYLPATAARDAMYAEGL